MATNISPDEVRYTGNLSSSNFPDAMINSAAYIPAGDAWINKVLADNSELVFASIADANKKALAKAAECWYVAGLLTLALPLDDIQAGPVQTRSNAAARIEAGNKCFEQAKKMLSLAGYSVDTIGFTYSGGDDYQASGVDGTNVDMGIAQDDSDYPVNLMGMEP